MSATGRSARTQPIDTLIVGCGDTGVRVAARAVAAGEAVTGVVASPASARRVRAVGARALQCDLDADPLHDALNGAPGGGRWRRLFYFAPPPRSGAEDSRMARVLAALGPPPAQVVYIGTSGVYGDCGGDWVDEDRPLNPGTERARRRVDAERRLFAWCAQATVLRAPGIYGPGRLPVQRVRDGEPVIADAEGGWSNRVHIDDLAAIAWRAGNEHWAHRVYNACDGQPTPLSAYYDTLADLIGADRPPRITWAEAEQRFSPMRLSFLRESRRLSNQRLCADSGYRFRFADYRVGLEASLRAQL